MSELAKGIRRFLERAAVSESRVVLDGCGPNGAVQYETLSMLGLDRILQAQEVHILSSSTFAYLFFLARHRGHLALSRGQIRQWDAIIRKNHGVVPGLTLFRSAARLARGRSADLPVEGLGASFREVVNTAFGSSTVGELPANVRCWLYNADRRQLQVASAQDAWSRDMPLATLVQAAANVPRMFSDIRWKDERLVDPIFSPLRRELYAQLRRGGNVLVSNIFRSGEAAETTYVRPTRLLHGRTMLWKDFGLFISGLPNRALGSAVDRGLFETAPL